MIFHCSHISREKGRASAIPCARDAMVLWKDKDGVRHGWCPSHLRDGHLEAAKYGWTICESALEEVAA